MSTARALAKIFAERGIFTRAPQTDVVVITPVINGMIQKAARITNEVSWV